MVVIIVGTITLTLGINLSLGIAGPNGMRTQ